MRQFHLVLLAFTWLLALPAMALDKAVETGWFNDTAISGYDTVAYFTEGKPVEGDKKFKHEWRGAQWHFASQENLDTFKANPVQYAPQYGGWCAYAMSDEGRTVGVDPEAFYVHNGKLYLNYSKSVQKAWLETRDTNIVEADGFYPQTTDINDWLKKEAPQAN